MRSFLFAALAVLVVSSFSVQAAQKPFSLAVKPNASPSLTVTPATAPGFALGLVEAGEVVSGFVPCFGTGTSSCPAPVGTLEIPEPLVEVSPGGQVEIAFTMQTLTSTTIEVPADVVQNKTVLATLLSGELSGLETTALYVVYGTDPSTLPSTLTPGSAQIVATATDGTSTSATLAFLLVK